ncbi:MULTISPECIES: LysR substrate-binding domain-containing protein [unclassified Pseudomonas]|uniref:LysR substrate-binding domain-containing protein n=1 Tax=unclassified Pseudomonas TaxID=196821 RepID=UPI000D338B81|nr:MULTISPECIES: LysR substrate-binding domain-containing protein [unclassified Pseudomonas]RAU40349.1 LysR family transcriptional regulator [Pseudomonas sp. RIT 409]RAU55494.1 LysR family transcriptional regulator [Pseudomonas sp. RIT 412]
MIRNLDLTLVRTFVAVADHRSMTVAANLLFMTQGAVSQQVKRLEEHLGCVLLLRKPRHLELTHQGELFRAKARRLLQLNDEIWADTVGGPQRGHLRVGAPPDLITAMAPALKAFTASHPRVELSLKCAASPELHEDIENGHLDFALIEYVASHSQGEVIRTEPLLWVGSADSDIWKTRPLPLSLVDERCVFRPVVLGALAKEGIVWRTVFENRSFEATASTVRAGLAITAWLASTVPDDLVTLGAAAGLPTLPEFAVCVRVSATAQPVAEAFRASLLAAMDIPISAA